MFLVTVLGTTSRVSQISKTIHPNVSSKTLPKASEASANWFEKSKLEQKCEQRLRAFETCTQHSRQNKISSITVTPKISFFPRTYGNIIWDLSLCDKQHSLSPSRLVSFKIICLSSSFSVKVDKSFLIGPDFRKNKKYCDCHFPVHFTSLKIS